MIKRVKNNLLVVCIVLLFVMIVGCGDSSKISDDKEIKNVDSVSSTTTEASAMTTEKDITSTEVTIKEQVLFDEQDVKITATSLSEGWMGPEVNILIENNSDKTIIVQVRNASINGFMVDPTISEEVNAGKKSNASISFMKTELEECEITTLSELEFSFHFIGDDWQPLFDSDIVRLETSAYGTYNQKIDASGNVLFDQDGIKIVAKGLAFDKSVLGPELILYIEDNSEKDITVQARNTSVNGFMVETTISENILAGKRAVSSLTIMKYSLEENGITDIKSLETSFHVLEMEQYGNVLFDTDTLKIDF